MESHLSFYRMIDNRTNFLEIEYTASKSYSLTSHSSLDGDPPAVIPEVRLSSAMLFLIIAGLVSRSLDNPGSTSPGIGAPSVSNSPFSDSSGKMRWRIKEITPANAYPASMSNVMASKNPAKALFGPEYVKK